MRERRTIGPEHLLELRAAVAAAIPLAYRPAAAMLGRLLTASAEPVQGAADQGAAAPAAPGAAAAPAASSSPGTAGPATEAAAAPQASAASPALERLIVALRGELDRAGVVPPARRDARIPVVPLAPLELPEEW
jgi:hypothetical protein